MPDLIDRALEVEELHRQRALDAQGRRADFNLPSLAECQECSEEIPAERQQVGGITRCVPCQELFEKWGK